MICPIWIKVFLDNISSNTLSNLILRGKTYKYWLKATTAKMWSWYAQYKSKCFYCIKLSTFYDTLCLIWFVQFEAESLLLKNEYKYSIIICLPSINSRNYRKGMRVYATQNDVDFFLLAIYKLKESCTLGLTGMRILKKGTWSIKRK